MKKAEREFQNILVERKEKATAEVPLAESKMLLEHIAMKAALRAKYNGITKET